jgi:hypothetical protein
MNCEAKTSEGKQCSFTASKQVHGVHYCGNHAAKARVSTGRKAIMFDRAPKVAVRQVLPKPQGAKTELAQVGILETLTKPPRMVDQVFALIEAGVNKNIIEQILQAWKVGAL